MIAIIIASAALVVSIASAFLCYQVRTRPSQDDNCLECAGSGSTPAGSLGAADTGLIICLGCGGSGKRHIHPLWG